ncbi:MAG: Nuclear transport factor 2 family protein [Thermoproteota archaeon]|nr:Nuclear transport factor 2 family protein [Thermoproteota archaeon]
MSLGLRNITSILLSIYDNLSKGNIDRMLSFFSEDAVLEWGPFTFKGRDDLKKWSLDLRQMFPQISFKLNEPKVQENKASHGFVISITASNGRRGLIHVLAQYEFENSRIKHAKIDILEGTLVVRKQELPSE